MSDRQNLDRIAQIETFARQHMEGGEVGHDFKHVDRVRHHALYIAQHTSYDDLDKVQTAGCGSTPRCSLDTSRNVVITVKLVLR